jgi:RNA polymerase sigma-70 factor, ECF subfamily
LTTLVTSLPSRAEPARLDVRAFVEREAPSILDYFGRRVPSADAADLLGETLVVVARRIGSIPSDELNARMWLFGVARKVLSTHRRSATRRTALADKLRLELAARPAAPDATAHVEVREAIASLPVRDREIIELVYWEGFSLEEVAGILSMRSATVRSRHARAKEKLRQVLVE